MFGGLRPHSDVDVLAVSTRRTTRAEKQRLVDRVLTLSGRRATVPARPIELTILVASEVRPWRPPVRFDFQYGEWLRDAFESGDVEPWPTTTSPDLAVVATMVLLGDRPLLGPPPAELLDPVGPVLARAKAIYLGEEDERWDDLAPRVRPHAAYVVERVQKLAAGGSPG